MKRICGKESAAKVVAVESGDCGGGFEVMRAGREGTTRSQAIDGWGRLKFKVTVTLVRSRNAPFKF